MHGITAVRTVFGGVPGWVWPGLFPVNGVMKEASLSRHPGWAEYRRRTGWLLPGL